MGVPLDDEVIELIESGEVAAWLATCDAAAKPEATRVMGTRVAERKQTVSLYVPSDQAGLAFANLAANGKLAVFYCRVTDYKAVQIKGSVADVRPGNAAEREHQVRYLREFTETCCKLQIPRETMLKLRFWPSVTLEMNVDAVFAQTPGPQAGMPWR